MSPGPRAAEAPEPRQRPPRGPQLTAATLRVLAVLEDSGEAWLPLADLAARADVPPRTAQQVAARLAAAGWAEAPPAGQAGGSGQAVRLSPGGQAPALRALHQARAAVARAQDALRPGRIPVPVPLGIRATGPDVACALVIRAFLGTPGRPRHSSELAARTGLPGRSLPRVIARMKAEGWVADAPPPASARAPGRPPDLLALTPAGRDAAPGLLATARSRLADFARDLGTGHGPGRPACRHLNRGKVAEAGA